MSLSGGWSDTWKDILQGGNKRWKVDDLEPKKIALKHITDNSSSSSSPLKILCPLAGDDPFVFYAWSKGHDVTAIDLVPEALSALRKQFPDDSWTSSPKEDQGLVWKHDSGRVTLYEGDMLKKRSELENKFDAIYDKDSFGALTKDLRPAFCERLSDYAKDDATLYIEVKYKGSSGREFGPPFHVEKSDLMESTSFGPYFNYVASLGELYALPFPGMQQTGHILKRMLRK